MPYEIIIKAKTIEEFLKLDKDSYIYNTKLDAANDTLIFSISWVNDNG